MGSICFKKEVDLSLSRGNVRIYYSTTTGTSKYLAYDFQ